ncbi:MAG: SRPBCC domain-containing protein [Lysobacter sp.]
MTARSAHHTEFTIEREFAVAPRKVFRAWADPQAKHAWTLCEPGMTMVDHRMDFRPGGEEFILTRGPDGTLHRFLGRYYDIVENERIVYAFSIDVDEVRFSVSLATVEFHAHGSGSGSGSGSRMVFTEQLAFLDGMQQREERIEGTQAGFDHLALYLHESPQRQ